MRDESRDWTAEKRQEWKEGFDAEPPPEIDLSTPSVARIYDYALRGKDNYPVDRAALDAVVREQGNDGIIRMAYINRGFLERGVDYLARAGVRQFIDVGSGLPTMRNVHEVAQDVVPDARVVYVDKDPIVLAHGRALLARNDTTVVVQADAADPDSILEAPETRHLIDFEQPWALVMCSILHHLTDVQDPVGVVRRFKDRMVPGCYLLACNMLSGDNEESDAMARSIKRNVGSGRFLPWAVHRQFFEGLEMVEPGLGYAAEWRADDLDPDRDSRWATILAGGLGRKP